MTWMAIETWCIEGEGTHSGPKLRPDDTERGRGLERWKSPRESQDFQGEFGREMFRWLICTDKTLFPEAVLCKKIPKA